MANERLPRNVRQLFRLPWRTAKSIANDVDDELRFHVEMRAAELIASGLDPDAATAEAWRSFGSPSDVREHAIEVNARVMRRSRVIESLTGLVGDVRFALRQARRTPMFTVIAVATLALGIGANTAIFSVVHRLIVAPFPFADSDRLAWVIRMDRASNSFILPDAATYDAWRTRAHSLEAIAVMRDNNELELRDGERTAVVKGGAMTASLFQLLGVRPALGRAFDASDERRGAPPVAMLGYDEWQTRFGGRPDVIGRTIMVDSTARVIIGVAPAGFRAPFENDAQSLWLPWTGGKRGGSVLAKVRRGVAIDAVNRELTAVAAQVPSNAAQPKATAQALRQQDIYSRLRDSVLLLFVCVGLVLLIACANVANLLLVRAWSRRREFAIRTALGAGRARLVRQLLAECLTIALAGGALGLAIAAGAIRVVGRLRPRGLEVLEQVRIEPAALGWTVLIAVGTGLVFGLAPALFATSRGMTDGLKAGARDTEGRGSARVFRSTMIVAEIALSVVLLVGAGLLVRSIRAMDAIDLGWTPSGLHSLSLSIDRKIPSARHDGLRAEVLQRLRATPGIRSAVFATSLPPDIYASGDGLQPVDRPASAASFIETSGYIAVQPGFFRMLGIPVRGRTFDADSTGRDSLPAHEIIVNERLARRLFPNADPVGQRVRVGKTIRTVVGVAGDLNFPGEIGAQWDFQYYTPWTAGDDDDRVIIVRSELGDRAFAAAIDDAMRSVSSHLSIRRSQTSAEGLRLSLAPTKFATTLLGGFAFVAMCLSIVGLYGVIAYTVSRRTREIGVRIALGAQPRDIAQLVLRRGAVLVGAGLLGGIALSVASSRLLQAYLYGVGEHDPMTYAGIVALLGAAALFATYLPARRAMQVDPVVALSSE